MDDYYASQTLELPARQSQVLAQAAGVEVQCLSGEVWITQYGDSRDIVLTPGRAYMLELPNAVVGARRGATLRLRSAAAGGGRKSGLARWLSWLDPRWGSRVSRDLAGRWPVRRYPVA